MSKKTYTRFMILSSPRSGTHMLRTSLNSNPAIVTKTEVFNPDFLKNKAFDENTDDREILDQHVFTEYPESIQSVGFILHRSGARFGNWHGLWDRLAADRSLKIISLTRQNLLRRFVSHQLMRDRNRNLPVELKYFPVDDLRNEFLHQEKKTREMNARFAQHEVFHTTYEELCTDYVSTMRNLQLFLGVDVKDLQSSTRRNPANSLEKVIGNFDELADAFRESRWNWYFRVAPALKASHQVSIDLGG